MYFLCRLSESIRLDLHSQARTLSIAVIVILDHFLSTYRDHHLPLSNSYRHCVAAPEASIILTAPLWSLLLVERRYASQRYSEEEHDED